MLAIVAASLLASWCDQSCVQSAHPLFERWGFGAPEVSYGFTLTSSRNQRVHRFQLAWALPVTENLEVFGGAAFVTDGRFELVPGGRFSIAKVGNLVVPAVAFSAPMSWRAQVLDLRVRPAIELHVGMAVMQLAVEIDVAGREKPRLWCGFMLSL